MFEGQIVYLPYRKSFIRYVIKKIMDDDLLVTTYKSCIPNCVSINDVLTTDDFARVYVNETIYE